jgi:hypothetical protein
MSDVWTSSGVHLLDARADGTLGVTPEFLAAYFARPEMRPVAESCAAELRLHQDLLDNPVMPVSQHRLGQIADADARENYAVVLAFRDLLLREGTLEKAYLAVVRSPTPRVPPLFLDQLVHAVLAYLLRDCPDPLRWRAAEIFFREQKVSTGDGRVMLADEETVEMYAASGGMGGLGQLLIEADTPVRQVELDVLDEDNKSLYWQRSERFDTVVDFRFTQPANDAFARVVEAWVKHFLDMRVRVQPLQRIEDEQWVWHIGLDAEATRLLNALYEGRELSFDEAQGIIGLFRMDVLDRDAVLETVRGRPIYLALAKTPSGTLKMKPQNLIVNMPIKSTS